MSVGPEHRSESMPFRSSCLRAYFNIAATLSFVTTSRPVWMIGGAFCLS
ncbi:hypothetical protein ACVI1K_000329 [Bradyrhizobium sp. USDA 4508]